MKIRIIATIDIPRDSLPAARELACADTNAGLRLFVQNEAIDYVVEYLDANGVLNVTSEVMS